MALPPLEKTWEYDVNREWAISTGSDETAGAQLSILVKDQLLDQSHHGIGGTIASVTPGVTYSLTVTNIANRAGNIVVLGSDVFTAALVGKYIEVVGAVNGGNNGVFQITSVIGTEILHIANAGGVAEVLSNTTSSWRISRGSFTSGAGGVMSPWRCQGSGAGSTGRGSGHDKVDRWISINDLQSSTSDVGNKSWFVWENTVTGAQFCMTHRTDSASFDWIRARFDMSPEIGFSGGTATVIPTATDRQTSLNAVAWIGTSGDAKSRSWFGHLAISSDGFHTFYFNTANSRIGNGAVFQKCPAHADFIAAPRPWSGDQNVMMWGSATDAEFWTIDSLTDTARVKATIDHLGTDGGPFVNNLVWTTEFADASQLPEIHDGTPDRLDPPKWLFYRVGLAATTVGVRGRIGRLVDVWAVNESDGLWSAPSGSYFPGSTARTRLKLGNFMIPWNGSVLRRG